MLEKLVCDRCSNTYADRKSIESAKRGFKGWKKVCQTDSVLPRGLCPCPIVSCLGELVLKTE